MASDRRFVHRQVHHWELDLLDSFFAESDLAPVDLAPVFVFYKHNTNKLSYWALLKTKNSRTLKYWKCSLYHNYNSLSAASVDWYPVVILSPYLIPHYKSDLIKMFKKYGPKRLIIIHVKTLSSEKVALHTCKKEKKNAVIYIQYNMNLEQSVFQNRDHVTCAERNFTLKRICLRVASTISGPSSRFLLRHFDWMNEWMNE